MPRCVYHRQSRAPPRPPKGLLSLRDYTVIHAALEVVVHWGLVPVLEPGVGVFQADKRPRSRAVKISRRVLHHWEGGRRSPPAPSRAPVRSGSTSSGAGVGGVVTTAQFMPMLMPLYLPDLLAARMQLVYGRTAAAVATAATSTVNGCNVGDQSTGRATPSQSLRATLRMSGPRQVMGALRHLLSEGVRAPPWFRQRAGRILSEIVLQPGGVQATLEVYLAGAAASQGGEGGGGGEEGDETRACLRVAKLLATPPKSVRPGQYVARVAPQLAEMLH
ncbi:unnamed protein product, partial [Laminaria digitata]